MENFLGDLTNFEQEVANEIISTTTVLTYIHHEPSIEVTVKSLESIFSYHSVITDEQKQQKDIMKAAGYTHFEDYEKELVKYISDGTYDKQAFNKEVNLLNERQKNQTSKKI